MQKSKWASEEASDWDDPTDEWDLSVLSTSEEAEEDLSTSEDDFLPMGAIETAAESFSSDPAERKILVWAMWFANSLEEPKPEMFVEDIPFYMVGRNSTHYFYAGYKDGIRYRGTEYVGETPMQYRPLAENELFGYMGHC